ncbi:MAG: hypothetical protein FE78DRAFT_29053 [Acidomyces sp. 'richmondensis']|nr:MAG: hypothetical protein FE78DRAFT_29053 [Acidomyces sp. 'richmondensis']
MASPPIAHPLSHRHRTGALSRISPAAIPHTCSPRAPTGPCFWFSCTVEPSFEAASMPQLLIRACEHASASTHRLGPAAAMPTRRNVELVAAEAVGGSRPRMTPVGSLRSLPSRLVQRTPRRVACTVDNVTLKAGHLRPRLAAPGVVLLGVAAAFFRYAGGGAAS